MWLVSSSSYRQDRKKKINGTFFKILTGKNCKIVCRKKVLLVFKNVQNLFFTPKFLLSGKNIPNCVHLDPCTLNFDQFYMTWNHLTRQKKHFYCFHQIAPGLQFQQLTRIKGRKICCLFQTLTGKRFKIVCRNIVTLSFQKSFAASIELWLVSNSSYWPDKKKGRKNCSLFESLTFQNL